MSEITFVDDVEVSLIRRGASDADVPGAARVSTVGERVMVSLREAGFRHHAAEFENEELSSQDRGLINFLMRDRHGTPFEHNSMTFFVRAPIFVAREFMRHRAGWSYNEESGRYRELDPRFYVPGSERKLIQVGKPGAYRFEAGSTELHEEVVDLMCDAYSYVWVKYQRLLEIGTAREVARMILPVGIFTSFYATCNARSLMHFLSLRTINDNATVPTFPQREIEMVADQMEALWEDLMPVTHAAFNAHGRVAP